MSRALRLNRTFLTRDDCDDVQALISALDGAGRRGMSPLAAGNASGLAIDRVQEFVARFPDYFVRAAGTGGKILLNAFGPFSADAEAMREDARKTYARSRWTLVLGAVAGMIFLLFQLSAQNAG